MIKWLNKKYDARRDIVAKGNVIDTLISPFLQGGSGFIISRRAAEEIILYKKWILYEAELVDDIRFSDVWKIIGVRMNEANSGFFLGHQFKGEMEILINRQYWKIPMCPSFNPQQTCGSRFHHLRDLTVLHTIWNHTQLKLAANSIFKHVPSNIYWHQNGMFPIICKMPVTRHIKERIRDFTGYNEDI